MCTRGSRGLYSMTNFRSGFSLGQLADAVEECRHSVPWSTWNG